MKRAGVRYKIANPSSSKCRSKTKARSTPWVRIAAKDTASTRLEIKEGLEELRRLKDENGRDLFIFGS